MSSIPVLIAQLRQMAQSAIDVGQSAARDRHRRASSRFGRRAVTLKEAADALERYYRSEQPEVVDAVDPIAGVTTE